MRSLQGRIVGCVALVAALSAVVATALRVEAASARPAVQVRRAGGRELVVTTAARGTVRLTVPASTRTDDWQIESAVVGGDVNGDGIPDLAVAVDHFHHSAPLVVGRCGPPLPHEDYVQVIFGGRLPPRIDLAHPTVSGFRISAPPGTSAFGSSLAATGDVNGDGLDDLLVGAPGGVDEPGAAYVVYGKRSSSPVDVSDLGGGGFALAGPGGSRVFQAGSIVAGGGDVNGDGRPDLLVGAQWRTPEYEQELKESRCGDAVFIEPPHSAQSVVYVVLGGARTGTLDLGDLGANGFAIGGSWRLEDVAGRWLANAGDVNGDGLADVAIGTRSGALIVYGRRSTTPVNPDSLGDGGVELSVPAAPNTTPVTRSLAGIGDVNGDGLADVAVGSPSGANYPVGSAQAEAPSAYVIFGSRSPVPVDVSRLGGRGFSLDGTRDSAGDDLVPLGDLNGDGVADFGVLAPATPYGGWLGAGSLYAVYGKRSTAPLRLDALGAAGARIDGSPGTSVYDSGGAGRIDGSRESVLVSSGESVELVPFTPKPAPPAPALGPVFSVKPAHVTGLATGFGSVWVLAVSGDNRRSLLYRLDPRTNRLERAPVRVAGPARVVATALGSVWVLAAPPHRDRPATLVRFDPRSGRILLRARVGGPGHDVDQVIPAETIHSGLGSLWITYGATGSVYRVDPRTGRTVAAIRVGSYPQALAFADGKVWVADRADGAVRELDPATNRVVGAPIDVSREPASQGTSLGDMLWIGTGANGTIWLYDPVHDRVVRLDPHTRALRFDAESRANGEIAVAAGPLLWVVGDRTVGRVRIADGKLVGSPFELDTWPLGAAATARSLWTTTLDGSVVRIDR